MNSRFLSLSLHSMEGRTMTIRTDTFLRRWCIMGVPCSSPASGSVHSRPCQFARVDGSFVWGNAALFLRDPLRGAGSDSSLAVNRCEGRESQGHPVCRGGWPTQPESAGLRQQLTGEFSGADPGLLYGPRTPGSHLGRAFGRGDFSQPSSHRGACPGYPGCDWLPPPSIPRSGLAGGNEQWHGLGCQCSLAALRQRGTQGAGADVECSEGGRNERVRHPAGSHHGSDTRGPSQAGCLPLHALCRRAGANGCTSWEVRLKNRPSAGGLFRVLSIFLQV